ncbi:MAG TPA: crotonyl-CoA carboxylase/reductase [Phytomonospora sp.]
MVQEILEAIRDADTTPAQFAAIPLPEHYRGVTLHRDEAGMFDGLPSSDKDPRRSMHLDEVPVPELGPGEALVAVMASAINYNTVWSSIFEPIPTFAFLSRYGRMSPLAKRHDLPYHVLGSDLSGVVLRTGAGVNNWKPGDQVVAHCLSVELESAEGHDDTMLDPEQRIWGFETNFGGLAEIALVKTNQLMPKPAHLTWEEAASPGLVNSTAYRQLISANGAAMKQGDNVLIWGASGGLGSYAVQYALAGGATPVCVVSSPEKAALCEAMGAEAVIDRSAEDYRFWLDEHNQDPKEWKRLGARIRELTGGEDVDIVFEHPGRETFGASVFVAKRGGTIVTCASTSGYTHEYDNRYLWMNLKRIVGSHFANYKEAWAANRLIAKGRIHPTLSRAYKLEHAGQAAYDVHKNLHQGKVGVLCLSPEEGLGVTDHELREKHEAAINRFRDAATPSPALTGQPG